MSIDGYVADIEGKSAWFVWNWGDDWTWDDKLKKYYTDVSESVDRILLSTKMVGGFIDHWEKISGNPNHSQYVLANNFANAHKVIFTNSINKSEWKNTVLAKGDLADEINKLKNQKDKDIIVFGGASFVNSVINTGLIDEYHIIVNPVTVGSGMTIFKKRTNLKLIDAVQYSCGIVVIKYKTEY